MAIVVYFSKIRCGKIFVSKAPDAKVQKMNCTSVMYPESMQRVSTCYLVNSIEVSFTAHILPAVTCLVSMDKHGHNLDPDTAD